MSEKKILHLTSMNSTKFGGLENYFLEIAQYSKNKNLKIFIQYNNLPKSKDYLNKLYFAGVKVRVKPINTYSIQSIINVFKLIKSIKPNIIHCHFINRNIKLFIPIFSKLFRVEKLFYSVHGSIDYNKYQYIRFFINKFDNIFPVSKEIFNRLIKSGIDKKKINTIYLGLSNIQPHSKELNEKYRVKYKIGENSILLACIAFDNPVKGVDVLIKAFSEVFKNINNIELMIIGIDPENTSLRELSKKLGIDQNIHWIGIVDNASILLNAADIYIQPSRSEGLCLAILEAMSQKLPVIASRVGGTPEAVIHKKTGLLVEKESFNDLSKSIIYLIEHPEQRKNMGEKGYEHFQKSFDGKKSVKNLVDNYYLI